MKFWFLPPALYEAMPYLCLIVGLVALLGVPAIMGKLCGVLLSISGWIIRTLRIDYRSKTISRRNMRRDRAGLATRASIS